ncbi:hypothetical protein EO98_19535 [Methanosarcina sp. 2.H.T.1A.6]|uniref:hypothetical protein n=1 Tax=unclassified Methanosarcina TaxID=2644672 RepID=UPI000621B6C7|nr:MULTISPECIES: hypothetical protein [unclassified Methanosarcina]KKG16962.1 hypothetical protein EO97_05405 [Methanosarcina sp. 2.H.T.1A.15]KKG17844.1 hypothetical protein EO94_14965 [Methanosarcina sp. 2.H.T.1A.3]KKG19441.1 hypothetical protein EO98_19535 [Methanosarcina sp. 2.H.T.1A.6]KKG27491.1 hypothetical protein EO96_10910 [Methanosarcina sp. 2.H.T.1A.8]
MKKFGWDGKNYLDAWEMLKQINQAINEANYGFFDAFIWANSTIANYWLFIVPKSFEDGKLWNYFWIICPFLKIYSFSCR